MATNFSPVLGVLCFKPIPKFCNVWYDGISCGAIHGHHGPLGPIFMIILEGSYIMIVKTVKLKNV